MVVYLNFFFLFCFVYIVNGFFVLLVDIYCLLWWIFVFILEVCKVLIVCFESGFEDFDLEESVLFKCVFVSWVDYMFLFV